jgi:hypothetical protein
MADINQNIDLSDFVSNPINLFYFLVFNSPLIISLIVFSSGLVYQNLKGFFYLFFLIIVVCVRSFFIANYSKNNDTSNNEYKIWEANLPKICNNGRFVKSGQPGLNLFVIAYSFMYLCLPMMINQDINYLVFGALLLSLGGDIAIRYLTFKCVKDVKQILGSIFNGVAVGTFIVFAMYSLGMSQYLFFNEISTNSELCKVQAKQKFKCTISNNGQVVGTVMK